MNAQRYSFGILLVAGILATAAPCAGDSADEHYATGRGLLSQGNLAGARKEIARAVQLDPGHLEARYRLALIDSEDINRWEDAEREFRDFPATAEKYGVRNLADVRFRSGLALAKLYVRSGRTAQAINILRGILADPPKSAAVDEARATLGIANYYERIYDDAMLELRQALKTNPQNNEARFNLKTIRARLEHFQAGKAYSRLGHRDGAIHEFRQAIKSDPRFIEARHRLGVELHMLARYEEAIKEFRRAESISLNYRKMHEIWFAEGRSLKAMGKVDEAKKKFLAILVNKPKYADAHNEIGQIHMDAGNYEAATVSFITAIGIDPRTEYVRNLQICMQKQKDKSVPPAPPPDGSAAPPPAS